MKAVMLCNAIVFVSVAVCVTVAAMYFNNAHLLWWYVLIPFLGFSYDQDKKGE